MYYNILVNKKYIKNKEEVIKMKEVFEIANKLVKNYTFELYCKLYDMCEEKGLFFAEERDGESLEFWIEDEHFICES
nr:MAG TPA: hypothetical protein [Caudoviricetes sp.]